MVQSRSPFDTIVNSPSHLLIAINIGIHKRINLNLFEMVSEYHTVLSFPLSKWLYQC